MEALILLVFVVIIWAGMIAIRSNRPDDPPSSGRNLPSEPHVELHDVGIMRKIPDAPSDPDQPAYERGKSLGAAIASCPWCVVVTVVIISATVWWIGKPWSLEECLDSASDKPTDRGVMMAKQACHQKFGYPR